MLREHLLKLTDFTVLLDTELWKDEEGHQGKSPFDATFFWRDLQSSKTLEYWDFLVANAQWFNAISAQALDDARTIVKEHDRNSSIILLENMLSCCACRKALGLGVAAIEMEMPAKHSSVMWKEARIPAPAASAEAGKQQ